MIYDQASLSYPTKLVRNPSPKSSDSHRFHGDEEV